MHYAKEYECGYQILHSNLKILQVHCCCKICYNFPSLVANQNHKQDCIGNLWLGSRFQYVKKLFYIHVYKIILTSSSCNSWSLQIASYKHMYKWKLEFQNCPLIADLIHTELAKNIPLVFQYKLQPKCTAL